MISRDINQVWFTSFFTIQSQKLLSFLRSLCGIDRTFGSRYSSSRKLGHMLRKWPKKWRCDQLLKAVFHATVCPQTDVVRPKAVGISACVFMKWNRARNSYFLPGIESSPVLLEFGASSSRMRTSFGSRARFWPRLSQSWRTCLARGHLAEGQTGSEALG